ncbi:MAG: type II secretion system protein [Verrucomicrobiota bacterium]
MKIAKHTFRWRPVEMLAFTLPEVMISVAIIGIMFVTLYGGISSGFGIVQLARENLRATQILLEKMETVRLYSWDQVNSNGFIPSTFSASFYPGATNSGIQYSGTISVTNVSFTEAYSGDLRQVVLKVQWTSGQVVRNREMRTFVSRYGLQNYIY